MYILWHEKFSREHGIRWGEVRTERKLLRVGGILSQFEFLDSSVVATPVQNVLRTEEFVSDEGGLIDAGRTGNIDSLNQSARPTKRSVIRRASTSGAFHSRVDREPISG